MTPFTQQPLSRLPARPRRAHDWHSTHSQQVDMDSAPFGRIRVHYRETGRGPPLLLVHGLMTSSYSWRYVMTRLGEAFHVIAPDLPGAGRSDKPDGRAFTPPALTTWIGEFQRALGMTGCLCIGNSLGGYLCMRLALDDKNAFSRLVNIHSPGMPDLRLKVLHAAFQVPGAMALLEKLVRRDPLKWVHRNVHYYDESLKSLEEAREYAHALSTREGIRCFGRHLSETLAPDAMTSFIATLQSRCDTQQPFPIPLLLLYARADPMVPPSVGNGLHALLPDAQFEWLENTSHFMHVDTPDVVIARVMPFLVERAAAADAAGPAA